MLSSVKLSDVRNEHLLDKDKADIDSIAAFTRISWKPSANCKNWCPKTTYTINVP